MQTEAAPQDTNPVRSIGLQAPVWDLAQLASGTSPEAWRSRKADKYLDATHRRIVRWTKACNVMLRRWFAVKARGGYSLAKADLSVWLRTKYKTLSQALERGEILQIDVLDAVVRSPSSTASAPAYCSLLTSSHSFRSTSRNLTDSMWVLLSDSRLQDLPIDAHDPYRAGGRVAAG